MRSVEIESLLAAPADVVWERVSTFEGVNDELRPLLRMTAPARVRALDPADVVLGERMFRSWVLLFGLIPIDYDNLSIAALEPGRSFHEKSTMLSMRSWQHERTLTPLTDAVTRVHDRITFEPRILLRPSAGPFRRVFAAFFAHRHRRLARHFG